MAHATFLLVGFICCEGIFAAIEHWFKGHEARFRTMKHTAFVCWMFHPTVLSGAAEWTNHIFAIAMAGTGH